MIIFIVKIIIMFFYGILCGIVSYKVSTYQQINWPLCECTGWCPRRKIVAILLWILTVLALMFTNWQLSIKLPIILAWLGL